MVLLSDPSTLGAGDKTCLESRIKKLNPHCLLCGVQRSLLTRHAGHCSQGTRVTAHKARGSWLVRVTAYSKCSLNSGRCVHCLRGEERVVRTRTHARTHAHRERHHAHERDGWAVKRKRGVKWPQCKVGSALAYTPGRHCASDWWQRQQVHRTKGQCTVTPTPTKSTARYPRKGALICTMHRPEQYATTTGTSWSASAIVNPLTRRTALPAVAVRAQGRWEFWGTARALSSKDELRRLG